MNVEWRPQTFSHVVRNDHEIDCLNGSGGVPVSFERLPTSQVHIAFSGIKSETLSLWQTFSEHGFKTVPNTTMDVFTLRFVENGNMLRTNFVDEPVYSRPGYATFVGFEDMNFELATPAFAAVTATLTRRAILMAAIQLDGQDRSSPDALLPFVELKTTGLLALRQSLMTLHRRLKHDVIDIDFVAALLEELIVYQLLTAWPRRVSPAPAKEHAHSRAVRRALDYIEANLARQTTLAEIARAAGVTVRTLQRSFMKDVGRSPVSFLIDRRLDRVHDDLRKDAAHSVKEIAARYGFAHMSDFSRRYRLRFGSKPSAGRGT